MSENFDETDRRLLRALQTDASTSLEVLSHQLSLSVNTCWRRIKRLEEAGVIERRVALINPQAVGLDLTVFVAIRASEHSQDWLDGFSRVVTAMPEVTEFYRMAGDVDYLLKIVVGSVADYDRVYKQLIARVKLTDVSATFAMEQLKNTSALPI